ncbi:MAG: DoxX family membrane protein [Candidatus Eremiobacteraeota bacterium]|nr:DoxX family membrane protein [Candidatus Eremiobacteraeota bacterium]
MTKPLPASTTYARWLALFRIAIGAIWIAHALPKFLDSDKFMPPNGTIVSLVTQGSQQGADFIRPFLSGTVMPNIALFAELVRLGELLVGVVLVLGLFTRLGGLVGMFLTLMYASAKGPLISPATLNGNDLTTFLLSAINFVLPTGRALGIDALMGRRPAKVPTVRAEFVPEPPLVMAQPASAQAQPTPEPATTSSPGASGTSS